MQINTELISPCMITYLEDLSCLTLSDDEKERLTADLQNILNGISKLSELDTGGKTECSPHIHVNVFRDDEVRPSLDRELVLKNAPQKNSEMFMAPKTVE
jgi:aspartyl-tRNA(Asn)/glutamyl-tRNA(Gln) amidotransferase subunit C